MQYTPLQNELAMKPSTYRKLYSDKFNDLMDLQLVITKALMVCNQDPSTVSVQGTFELEAECLTDGSIVYNVFIR